MIVYMTSEPDHTNSGMHHLIRNFLFSRLYLFCMVPLKKIKELAIYHLKGKTNRLLKGLLVFF